jgi:hypothetical protein
MKMAAIIITIRIIKTQDPITLEVTTRAQDLEVNKVRVPIIKILVTHKVVPITLKTITKVQDPTTIIKTLGPIIRTLVITKAEAIIITTRITRTLDPTTLEVTTRARDLEVNKVRDPIIRILETHKVVPITLETTTKTQDLTTIIKIRDPIIIRTPEVIKVKPPVQQSQIQERFAKKKATPEMPTIARNSIDA